LWDPAAGDAKILTARDAEQLRVICVTGPPENPLVAVGSRNGHVRLWDPVTGALVRQLEGGRHTNALCSLRADGHDLLASGAMDGSVRVWDTATGTRVATLVGHTSGVNALCPVKHQGKPAIASVGYDRILRLWNPLTGSQQAAIPVHHPAHACVQVGGSLILALSAGLLAIQTGLYT
jgi:WD40 repeat protein